MNNIDLYKKILKYLKNSNTTISDINNVITILKINKKVYRHLIYNIKKSIKEITYLTENQLELVLNKKKYTNKLVYSNYSIYEYEDKFVYYFKNNNDEILKLNLNDKILQNVKIDNKTYNNINSIDKLLKKLLKKEIAFSFIIKK